jgi:hypothetical protein
MTADTFTRDKLTWLEQVARDDALTPTASRVAVVLATRFINRERGYAWPSIPTLAGVLAVSENTLRAALRALAAAGHLLIQTGGGRAASNRYRWIIRRADRAEAVAPGSDVNPANSCAETLQVSEGEPLDGTPLNEGEPPSPPSAAEDRRQRPAPRTDDLAAFAAAFPATPDTPTPRAVTEDRRTRRAWARALRNGAEAADLIAGARRYAECVRAEGRDAQMVARPANWLAAGAWEREHRPDIRRVAAAKRSRAVAEAATPQGQAGLALQLGAGIASRLNAAHAAFMEGIIA